MLTAAYGTFHIDAALLFEIEIAYLLAESLVRDSAETEDIVTEDNRESCLNAV
jgi:hypothetical protein